MSVRDLILPTDTPKEAALALFDAAEIRVVEREQHGWPGDQGNRPEIFHGGTWKSLHRTDIKDDVQTGRVMRLTTEQWRTHYRALIVYGARISVDAFACIDAYSDG